MEFLRFSALLQRVKHAQALFLGINKCYPCQAIHGDCESINACNLFILASNMANQIVGSSLHLKGTHSLTLPSIE